MDLINPNKTFKQNLVHRPVVGRTIPLQLEDTVKDPLAKLAQGDKVLYKNPKSHELQRWTEAIFIKRISPNVFQIAIGSNVISAHKGQIQPKEGRQRRRNVALPPRRDTRRCTKRKSHDSFDDEEPFNGFDTSMEQPRPARSECHPTQLGFRMCEEPSEESTVNFPRRSSRLKKRSRQDEFVYD